MTKLLKFLFFLLVVGPTAWASEQATTEEKGEETSTNNDVIPVDFEVQLSNGVTGSFTIEVHPEWAPLGAERFLELVDTPGFWKGIRFFRVIKGFVAQFGIPAKPDVAAVWQTKTLKDDPVIESNKRGYISFATSGEDSRTTQMFINLVDNINLDGMGFAPFGKVIGTGMEDVVDKIYSKYGDGAGAPDQGRVQSEGNKYLKKQFPNLSYIKSVQRQSSSGDAAESEL